MLASARVQDGATRDLAEIHEELEAWARPRVADNLTAVGGGILAETNIFATRLALASEILKVATLVNPDSLSAWNKRLELATATRDDLDASEALELEALSNIIRLDSGNIVARYRRLVGQVDLNPTAEERISDFEILLQSENIKQLGEAISSRLAFELALLQRRTGDMDGFAANLAKSVELDPSYPLAVDTAAGFFRMATDEPFAEVELMSAAITANPFNQRLQNSLGQFLLVRGAYEGASRVLQMAVGLGDDRSPDLVPLQEDLAMAQWGRGDLDIALRSLDEAIKSQAMRIMNQMTFQNPNLDKLELLRQSPPIQPQLAMAKAVVLFAGDDSEKAKAFQKELENSFSTMRGFLQERLELILTEEIPGQESQVREALGNLSADEAWARVWFSDDLSTIPSLVDDALEANVITGQQKQVIDAWLAFREKRYEEARTGFSAAGSDSSYAKTGLAMLDAAQGRNQSAARGFMDVYKQSPGSSLGLWCRERLRRMLGADIPAPAGADELNQIIDDLPLGVFRAVDDRRSILAIDLEPQRNPMEAFEPLILTVTLRNSLDIPLSIGMSGPIQPTIALVPEVSVASTALKQSAPLIFSIDRNFTIPARGDISFDINLSASALGLQLDGVSLQGATIRLRAVVNYQVVQENVTTGPFGEQIVSVPIRINGTYESKNPTGHLYALMKKSVDPRSVEDLIAMGMLAQYYQLSVSWVEDVRSNIRESLIQGFIKLPPYARAWLLARMPRNRDDMVRMVDLALATENPAVFAILLIDSSQDPGSPAIVAGRASNDPLIRSLATLARESIMVVEEVESRQFDIGDDEDDEFMLPGG